jgi:hypothetical protein
MRFDFEIPVTFFEKADAPAGQERRIGGIVSTENKDQQDEVVLQRGLDFSYFKKNGWFNDNHSKKTTDILGYPEATKYFGKGQDLPDGSKAEHPGHWVEGYLLRTEKADEIWSLGKALQDTRRRLGFSVEGKILQRTGPGNKTIAKALVRNVAITNCPVNTDSRMEILAKSLRAAEQSEMGKSGSGNYPDDDEDDEKSLGMGAPPPGNANPSTMGPTSGMGAGQIITPQSLESPVNPALHAGGGKKRRKRAVKKALTNREAFDFLKSRLPQASAGQIAKVIAITRRMKRSGN